MEQAGIPSSQTLDAEQAAHAAFIALSKTANRNNFV